MTSNALSRFTGIFGRKSSVVIGMIHVEALPGNEFSMSFFGFHLLFKTYTEKL